MTLVVRPMRPDRIEIEAVAAMRHAAFFAGTARTAAVDADGLERLLRATAAEAAFVAAFDGEVCGSCLLVARELDQHHDVGPWLAGLVVAAHLRGRGIGAALVGAVEREAARRGVTRLHLYTGEAERLYARLGWTVLDRFMDGDGQAATLMARDIR